MTATKPEIRTVYTFLEETHMDGVHALDKPTRKAACAVVFKNPYAGVYQEDLSLLIEWSQELGVMLTQKAVAALGIAPEKVESYGKAAIAGTSGEREHCAALMHPALGKPIRDNVGGGKALLPSAKKVGGPRLCHRSPPGSQGRRLCAFSFRCHGSSYPRCAPGR